MTALFQNVTHACFALSYLLALGFELAHVRGSRPAFRFLALASAAAGLLAHSLFLTLQHPTLATPYGALLAVAWVLSVFSLYGSIHHSRQTWALFVLPVVIGLILLALVYNPTEGSSPTTPSPSWLLGERLWGSLHGLLLVCAAVGISVGFLASVMYLVQSRRLRQKTVNSGHLKLLSLERLEDMNRRAVSLAFFMLTVGLLLGTVLLRQYHAFLENWWSMKVLGTVGLWVVFALLLYLRHSKGVPGRRLALGTILAFVLFILVLLGSHPFAPTGGTP